MTRSPKWSLPVRFSYHCFVCTFCYTQYVLYDSSIHKSILNLSLLTSNHFTTSHYLSHTHSNIILSSMPRCPELSFSMRFSNQNRRSKMLTMVSPCVLAMPCCWMALVGSELLYSNVTADGSELQCCNAEVGGCTPASWQHCTGSFIHFSRRASRDHSRNGNKKLPFIITLLPFITIKDSRTEIISTISTANLIIVNHNER